MNENSKPSINNSLRQERLLRGWSQQALADQLGTTIVTVSRWERGIQSPGPMMRLKLSRLFEKTESELGLFPEESVASPSPQNSQDIPISIPVTEPTADEAPEEVTPAEPAVIPSFTQETDIALPYADTEKQAPAHKFLAHQSPPKSLRPWFPAFRSSTQWVIALTGVLLLALIASLLLGLYHSPKVLSRGSAVRPRPSSTTETVPTAYGVHGHLVLDDALSNEQTGKLWYQSDANQATGCHFLNNSYDMRDVQSNYCLVNNTDYANFVYQIEMTTIQEQPGQTGRIIFRADDSQHTYYDFQVGANGSYFLSRNASTGSTVLAEGHSSAIIQGDLRPNLLAVKASGKDLFLYVNFRLIAHIQDLSYTSGNIGVGVDNDSGGSETEVAFRNAKVWTL